MKDYTIAQWIDLVRGIAPQDEALGMRHHLASGCASCVELAAFCETLAKTCHGLASHSVPESASRCARAIFPAASVRSSRRRLLRPIQLIYDSFLVPAPVGLRSSWESGFQALYHADEYAIDFRVEPGALLGQALIVGQIADRKKIDRGADGIPVCLVAGKTMVAHTRTNEFGEFQMDYEPRKNLRLRIELDSIDRVNVGMENSRHVEVPLRQLRDRAVEGSGSRQ